jgi:tRNA G10  N-methylase Trm11
LQLFIPGKNWHLSLAELASFLEARRIKFTVCSVSKEFFVFSVEEKVGAWIIDDLGGTIKIGDSVANFSTETVKRAFIRKTERLRHKLAGIL